MSEFVGLPWSAWADHPPDDVSLQFLFVLKSAPRTGLVDVWSLSVARWAGIVTPSPRQPGSPSASSTGTDAARNSRDAAYALCLCTALGQVRVYALRLVASHHCHHQERA